MEEQDVRLSVDEFVVPADVVSFGLGNGSSTAGAKKIIRYGWTMLEKKELAEQGQAPEVDAARLMPA